jgi:hypothetical protein
MKNFLLGYLAVNLGALALGCGFLVLARGAGWGMVLGGMAAGLMARGLWQAIDLKEGRLERPPGR